MTISRPALLAHGSDAEFRGLIHLIAYGHKLGACGDAFAAIAGRADTSPAMISTGHSSTGRLFK